MEYALLILLMVPPLMLAAYRALYEKGVGLDLGQVFTWVVFVYAWFPLLGLVLAQHGYGTLQDQRVISENPLPEEIRVVSLCYLAFLCGFALIYGWLRKNITSPAVFVGGEQAQVLIAVMGVVIVFTVNLVFTSVLGVNQPESYIDSYTQLRQFPLLVQQVEGEIERIELPMALAGLVFTIAWKPHLYKHVGIVVAGMLAYAVLSGGSRTFGFLYAFAYVVCLSIYVKRVNVAHLALIAAIGLVLFTAAGILRPGGGHHSGMLALFQGGEFFSVYINSVDILRRSIEAGGLDIAKNLYFVDLLRFIPQQILGYEKLDPAVWYASTYYPEYFEKGGGFAFGAIAESMVGFGIAEALVRGMLLGTAFAFVANRCLSGCIGPYRVFIYIWFVVTSYQAFRDTTFSIFPKFVMQVVPVLIYVWLVHFAVTVLTADKDKLVRLEANSKV